MRANKVPAKRGRPFKAARRGRPPGKKTTLIKKPVKRGRGRPKSPEVQKRRAEQARALKLKLRTQIREAKAQIKGVKSELKGALKREKKLVKLFASQGVAIGMHMQRWQVRQLKKLSKLTAKSRGKTRV
jgi:hypothetical protein